MKKFLGITTLGIVLIVGFCVYWFYFNVYSEGKRKGMLIKITKKGNVFKTFEGEMWLSCRQTVNVEKFLFSVTDKVVADSLEKMQDECLEADYVQYRKKLSWRGDTEYIITGFRRIGN
jgi:hypothetical protein